MPAKVILEVTQGSMKGKSFIYDSHDVFILGRRSQCQASIDDDYVSRFQFMLEANPPHARLMDLNSLHGTIVNGRRYGGRDPADLPADGPRVRSSCVDLNDGDRIQVGKTELLVRIFAPDICVHCGNELAGVASEPIVRGTLAPPDSNSVCAKCDVLAQEAKAKMATANGICSQCGIELNNADLQPESDGKSPSDSVCHNCRDEAPVGIKRLVNAARKVWKLFVIGNEWEGYEIESEIARGSMGIVYKAHRIADGRIVAIKTMLAKTAVSEDSHKMFSREIDVMSQLKHPNLVRFIESKSARNQFFFVMEFCNAGNLETLMEKGSGTITHQTAIPILLQCLDGIHCAHKAKVVHRDLKPSNVMLSRSDGKWTAKVGDLGLAKCFEQAGCSGLSMTGTVGGTLGFMPREQLTNFRESRPVSDIWSLAATFYNALTGFTPLDFPTKAESNWIQDVFNVILNNEPVPIRDRDPKVPAGLADILDRALLVDPARRYQSATEMKSDLLRNCSQQVAI